MATMITAQCINCGACEPLCPGEGISKGDDQYLIDPDRCTECVGFHAQQRCASVCPVSNCCVADPDRVETEEVLFERALKITSGDDSQPVLGPGTSHFRASSLPWWRRLMLNI